MYIFARCCCNGHSVKKYNSSSCSVFVVPGKVSTVHQHAQRQLRRFAALPRQGQRRTASSSSSQSPSSASALLLTSTTTSTTWTNADSNDSITDLNPTKKPPYYMKTYRINGHSMPSCSNSKNSSSQNHLNGCVGTTGTHTSSSSHLLYSHCMSTDLPHSMGGNNTAPQPMELLLMSYIGCTQATAYFVSKHIQIAELTNESISSPSSFSRYDLNHMIFHNIATERDIRGSIQNVPIEVIAQRRSIEMEDGDAEDDSNNRTNQNHADHRHYHENCNDNKNATNSISIDGIPSSSSHIQQISGEIIVYFSKSRGSGPRRDRQTKSPDAANDADDRVINDDTPSSNHDSGNTAAIYHKDNLELAPTTIHRHRQQQEEKEERVLYLLTLQEQTEIRCPIANMIHQSGCSTNNVVWKDGGESITKYES